MCCCSNRHILAYSLLLAWHTSCEAKTQPFQYLSSTLTILQFKKDFSTSKFILDIMLANKITQLQYLRYLIKQIQTKSDLAKKFYTLEIIIAQRRSYGFRIIQIQQHVGRTGLVLHSFVFKVQEKIAITLLIENVW
ncbi:Hypothetical_protein [Hexamita inflata]|uniref:Hypothetical_protein n=1 Tax=Hexamita inflata TaxID=28002 RepID=A0AA86PRV4_9EUKA|nr:Hypothetical protein HINF_LOCUS31256 [Hexamita inflata]